MWTRRSGTHIFDGFALFEYLIRADLLGSFVYSLWSINASQCSLYSPFESLAAQVESSYLSFAPTFARVAQQRRVSFRIALALRNRDWLRFTITSPNLNFLCPRYPLTVGKPMSEASVGRERKRARDEAPAYESEEKRTEVELGSSPADLRGSSLSDSRSSSSSSSSGSSSAAAPADSLASSQPILV